MMCFFIYFFQNHHNLNVFLTVRNKILFFLFLNQYMVVGARKNPFNEHPKHMIN